MNHEEFRRAVWRLEEILMHPDCIHSCIGTCGNQRGGLDSIGDEGLCPTCCDWFAQVLAEEEKLAEDREYNEVMRKLKEACDQDNTGQYESILNQSGEDKVFH
jgi:hypothetical protein